MCLKQYDERIKGLSAVHESIVEELSDFEKQIVNENDLMEIRGKVSDLTD